MNKNELTLIIDEQFGPVSCHFYRCGGTGDLWMTREQIGQALEYADPAVAIAKIHARHPDRLEKYSVCMPVERVYQVGKSFEGDYQVRNDPLNTGGEQDTYLYSNKGIMEICRWSRQPKADDFMDFVWSVMDKLIKGELQLTPGSVSGTLALPEVNAKLAEIQDQLSHINEQNKRIIKNSSYSSYYLHSQQRSGYDQKWEKKIMPAVNALADFMGIDSKAMLRKIYKEMEREFGITLNHCVIDYKSYRNVKNASALSVISYSESLRERFESILYKAIDRCDIIVPPPVERPSDLFSEIEIIKSEKREASRRD